MTITETLSNSESTAAFKESFEADTTISFSSGLEAKRNDYPASEATLSESLKVENSLPPIIEIARNSR